jgi:hypothetical protein
MGPCATTAGTHTVKGRVRNTHAASADYLITLSWPGRSRSGGAQAVATVDNLAPGKDAQWQLSVTLTQAATGCTLTVQRGVLH